MVKIYSQKKLEFLHSGAFQGIWIQNFVQPWLKFIIRNNIFSETIKNFFVLEHFRASKFKICFNHGESIDSERIRKSTYSWPIRNSVILRHFKAFQFKICFDHEKTKKEYFWSISEYSNLKLLSTMVKVLTREQLEVPSFWSISEHSNSKFS